MPARLELADPDPQSLTFGARMRHQRERRQISIAAIAETTKILGALIEGLEHDDVSRWPTGIYRRSFFRAYAGAIGLDPEPTLKEFLEHFPEPEPVATAMVGPAAGGTASVAASVPIRLRCFAAAVDWFVLSVLGLAGYVVTGWFWAPLSLAAAVYYAGGSILLGMTPGTFAFANAAVIRWPPAKMGPGLISVFALLRRLPVGRFRESLRPGRRPDAAAAPAAQNQDEPDFSTS